MDPVFPYQYLVLIIIVLQIQSPASGHVWLTSTTMTRNAFIRGLSFVGKCWIPLFSVTVSPLHPSPVYSLSNPLRQPHSVTSTTMNRATIPPHHQDTDWVTTTTGKKRTSVGKPNTVAYKSLSLVLEDFDQVHIPVAAWFPFYDPVTSTSTAHNLEDHLSMTRINKQDVASYEHRISVAKIAQLLAKWQFIPDFTTRRFTLAPTMGKVIDGQSLPMPTSCEPVPVILLAHGFLGSRFDLSHLAEYLAMEGGYVCLAAEYPESLSASYTTTTINDAGQLLDRTKITQALLSAVQDVWKIPVSSYGIVGHSLGCGTALQTGNPNWARVCLTVFPPSRSTHPLYQLSKERNALYICSKNDGLVARFGGIPPMSSDVAVLDKSILQSSSTNMDSSSSLSSLQSTPTTRTRIIPARSILVLDGPTAPNHISFLAENANNAMIDFLSPLLPLAQLLDIPVLDFDKYQQSRDSVMTAKLLHPFILRYLQQELIKQS